MTKKPIYEELEQKVKELEKEAVEHKRSKEELQTILNAVPVVIFQKDRDGKTILTNQAFDNLIGLSKEEIIGKTTDKLFPEHGKDMIKDDQEVMELGKPKLDIIEHYDSPEGIRWARTGKAPLKDKNGNVVGLIGYGADITEQKQIEEALRESEEKWRSLVENAPGFIINMDHDGTIQFINRGVPGISVNEATGHSIYQYIEPEYQNTARETIEQVFKTGKPSSYEVKGIGPDSHHISWYQTQVGPIKHDNQVIAATLIVTDITEHKRDVQALREREKELKIKTMSLEEVNTALRVLLKRRDEDKTELEEKVLSNVKELVVPFLEKVKKTPLDPKQVAYVDILESNLNDIISPFLRNLSAKYLNLTPTQIQVANLIKEGKTTKEIAELLNLSSKTINTHRRNIRMKLGMTNKKVNLRSHLLSLQK